MAVYEGKLNNIRIRGLASAVPKRVIDNIEFSAAMGKKKNKRQIMLTGIERRHICGEGQAASDFATIAAEKLLVKIGWMPEEIKLLIFVTQQPDLARPSTAMLIQNRLGIPNPCSCFDVNMGCSGFTVGLQIIGSMLSVIGGKGLLLVGDGRFAGDDSMISRDDLLFGDGGAAAAVEAVQGYPMLFNQYTDGRRFETIMCRRSGIGQMDGNGVLLFALNEVSENVRNFRTRFNVAEEDIDFYVYHQAQQMILKGIASETSVQWDKLLNSYQEYGNTSSASVPISICANVETLQQKKVQRLLMCGFGIGLSWGIVYMPIETEFILPIIETDYCYPDKAGL
ncbi:MAG: ketoacyl-ACP synthase III [Lachnospiraceae bacterium]|nr:ketoacyl-ACP synthase III [Lachnospiraceae bacterium]